LISKRSHRGLMVTGFSRWTGPPHSVDRAACDQPVQPEKRE